MTFMTEYMNRRTKSRDRFRVMSALRDAVSASLTKNIKKLGGG